MTDHIPVIEREMKEPVPFEPLVVGLVSEWPGIGASTFARYADTVNLPGMHKYVNVPPSQHEDALQTFGETYAIRMRGLLNEFARTAGLSDGIDTDDMVAMSKIHKQIRTDGNGSAVINGLEGLGRKVVLIDAIRHPLDAVHIKRRGGYILGLTGPEEVANARFLADNNDQKHASGPSTPERRASLEVAKRELQPEDPADPFSSDILSCLFMADIRVDFSGNDKAVTFALGMAALRDIALDKLGLVELTRQSPQIHAEIPA
ncbi:MAG TPA: hypothetical protein PKA02_00665 [Candidatus Saccharibacteria bacterium]|nr:hypothetical protein [Candidatus Saccharibacteria bacterium]